MAIFAGVLSGECTWFDELGVGFWSALDGLRFNAARPVADPLLRDEDQQAITAVYALAMMIPGDPELQDVLETELARSRVGATRHLKGMKRGTGYFIPVKTTRIVMCL